MSKNLEISTVNSEQYKLQRLVFNSEKEIASLKTEELIQQDLKSIYMMLINMK